MRISFTFLRKGLSYGIDDVTVFLRLNIFKEG